MVCKEWKDGELVRLNVGGKEFSTTVDTLTKLGKSEYLTALFAGKFGVRLDNDGRVFLDRDGERFRLVLNYLRCGTVHIKEDDLQSMHEVLEEAEFFGVNDLVDLLRTMIKEAEIRREKQREEEDKQMYAKIMSAHFPMSNVAVPVNLAAVTADPKYHQQIQQLHLLQQQYQLQQPVLGGPSPFALSGGHPTPNMLSQQSYSDATSTVYMNANQNPPGFPPGRINSFADDNWHSGSRGGTQETYDLKLDEDF